MNAFEKQYPPHPPNQTHSQIFKWHFQICICQAKVTQVMKIQKSGFIQFNTEETSGEL